MNERTTDWLDLDLALLSGWSLLSWIGLEDLWPYTVFYKAFSSFVPMFFPFEFNRKMISKQAVV